MRRSVWSRFGAMWPRNAFQRVAWLVACAASGAYAAQQAEIGIPGPAVFPESLTSTADGAVIIGSTGTSTIFRAAPGASTAQAWIEPAQSGLGSVFGVFADEPRSTLWVCARPAAGAPAGGAPQSSSLSAFDLRSGARKGSWPLPSAGAFCNDIAVGADGTAYATDTANMEIVRVQPGATSAEVWIGNGAFGPRGAILDGIAVVQGRVVVNTLGTGKLFSIAVARDGKAGPVKEVKLDRTLDRPDGQRALGDDLLVVESGGGGRLSRVRFDSAEHDAAQLMVLKEGFPGGPVAVTAVGETAFVLEGQLALRRQPDAKPEPFKATAVPLGER